MEVGSEKLCTPYSVPQCLRNHVLCALDTRYPIPSKLFYHVSQARDHVCTQYLRYHMHILPSEI